MALEAVVFPQDPFNYGCKDLYSLVEAVGGGGGGSTVGTWGHENLLEEENGLLGIFDNSNYLLQNGANLHVNWDSSSSPSVIQNVKDQCHWESNSSPEACTGTQHSLSPPEFPPSMEALPSASRRKRRRTRSTKNKEEIENQRMTHIAVERNRRKQMNEYLAVLRSLMPSSYVQRGDQASIIGGAINFVKELEQLLQSMEGDRKSKQQPKDNGSSPPPFAEFFSFPQYSTRATHGDNTSSEAAMGKEPRNPNQNQSQNQNQWAVADIEVTMVDSHANLKILSKKRPGQLLKMVDGFQSLKLSILHLNVTTVEEMVLYSVSVKLEEGCQLNTVDDIASAVNQLLNRIIQEEAACSQLKLQR